MAGIEDRGPCRSDSLLPQRQPEETPAKLLFFDLYCGDVLPGNGEHKEARTRGNTNIQHQARTKQRNNILFHQRDDNEVSRVSVMYPSHDGS